MSPEDASVAVAVAVVRAAVREAEAGPAEGAVVGVPCSSASSAPAAPSSRVSWRTVGRQGRMPSLVAFACTGPWVGNRVGPMTKPWRKDMSLGCLIHKKSNSLAITSFPALSIMVAAVLLPRMQTIHTSTRIT